MTRDALMRELPLLVLLLSVTACGGGGGGGTGAAVSQAAPPAAPGLETGRIQDVVEDSVGRDVDGMIVTVLANDGTLDSYSSGSQSRASGAPMDPAAPFKIASVSKLFIAVAAVQVSQQGLLSFDDTLAMLLPDLAPRIENSAAITVRQLLRHRSGIPDFDSQAGFSWERAHTDIDQVLEYALDLPADFSPDARYEYSNTNYLLLGMILDTVLSYSHHEFIQAFILDPLGMTDTWHRQDEAPTGLIRGYWDGVDTTGREYVVPGGSMVSTGADVATFLDALARGKLLSEAQQASYEDVYWYEHSGWLPGYQTRAGYESYPGVTLVVQVNNTGGRSEQVIADAYDEVLAILRR